LVEENIHKVLIMTYEQLIETVSLMVENEKIQKVGLTLFYELPQNQHNAINEALYYKANPYSNKFEPTEEFEVMLGGILVKFKQIS
jgi:F0F1-type ATP synthase delta subunit